ncbi:hypothetical protein QWY14_07670 [Planococcus sp. N028]|uniref:Uncharacterized protein n=1 Tax=Planococcus shixiaomingii TaxID=3058393 RepID=A0ABT8N192_9BACL|nr:hypothetical protein [Planococcus sp. N028]
MKNYQDPKLSLLKTKEEMFEEGKTKRIISNALKISSNKIAFVETLGGLTIRNYKVVVGEVEYAV